MPSEVEWRCLPKIIYGGGRRPKTVRRPVQPFGAVHAPIAAGNRNVAKTTASQNQERRTLPRGCTVAWSLALAVNPRHLCVQLCWLPGSGAYNWLRKAAQSSH